MIINRYAKGGGLSPRIVVSVTTGATVTCSKGATTLTATSVDGKCSFNVNDYGAWTVSTDSDTQTVNVEYVQLYEVTLKTISSTLNDNDWATIKEVADQSKGANYWSVGDTKQITINGKVSDGLTLNNYSTWVYIIGFDHNSEKEGNGIAFQGFKTAQANGTDICLCDNGYTDRKTSGQWFNINNNNSTSGGWSGCNMRNNTLPVVKAAFPSELTSVIKTTSIYTDNAGGGNDVASYVTATQDELYLLAEFEIFGAKHYANTAEQNYQKQYAYYVAGNSKVKYKHNGVVNAASWQERSVGAAYANFFCDVGAYGTADAGNADTSRGFAPAFKVGVVVTKPASTLPVGASVYAKESGTPAEFIVVHQGNPDASIYDTSCDGTWLMRKDLYNGQAWNTSGNNRWQLATLQQWLRDTYVNYLDVSSIIKSVKIPYGLGLGTGTVYTGADGLTSKAFLLSGYEVGYTTANNSNFPIDGTKLGYFESGGTESARLRRIANLNASPSSWWLRSPYTANSTDSWSILYNGLDGHTSVANSLGVRPCFIIPSDTEVDEFGNIVPPPQ